MNQVRQVALVILLVLPLASCTASGELDSAKLDELGRTVKTIGADIELLLIPGGDAYKKGEELLGRKKPMEALPHFQQALKASPGNERFTQAVTNAKEAAVKEFLEKEGAAAKGDLPGRLRLIREAMPFEEGNRFRLKEKEATLEGQLQKVVSGAAEIRRLSGSDPLRALRLAVGFAPYVPHVREAAAARDAVFARREAIFREPISLLNQGDIPGAKRLVEEISQATQTDSPSAPLRRQVLAAIEKAETALKQKQVDELVRTAEREGTPLEQQLQYYVQASGILASDALQRKIEQIQARIKEKQVAEIVARAGQKGLSPEERLVLYKQAFEILPKDDLRLKTAELDRIVRNRERDRLVALARRMAKYPAISLEYYKRAHGILPSDDLRETVRDMSEKIKEEAVAHVGIIFSKGTQPSVKGELIEMLRERLQAKKIPVEVQEVQKTLPVRMRFLVEISALAMEWNLTPSPTRQVWSKYLAGQRSEPNPDYHQAQMELQNTQMQYNQVMAQARQNEMQQQQLSAQGGLGALGALAVITNTGAKMAAEMALSSARQKLAETPPYVSRPQYDAYSYERIDFTEKGAIRFKISLLDLDTKRFYRHDRVSSRYSEKGVEIRGVRPGDQSGAKNVSFDRNQAVERRDQFKKKALAETVGKVIDLVVNAERLRSQEFYKIGGDLIATDSILRHLALFAGPAGMAPGDRDKAFDEVWTQRLARGLPADSGPQKARETLVGRTYPAGSLVHDLGGGPAKLPVGAPPSLSGFGKP